MKKSLLALAVLGAFAASAQAQTNVSIGGIVQANIKNYKVTDANALRGVLTAAPQNELRIDDDYTSRFWLTGTEDLGGGNAALFYIENRFSTDVQSPNSVGNGLGNGDTFVGLKGGWGQVTVGKHSMMYVQGLATELGANGVSAIPSSMWATFSVLDQLGGTGAANYITSSRVSNSILYKTPNLGGFSGSIGLSTAYAGTEGNMSCTGSGQQNWVTTTVGNNATLGGVNANTVNNGCAAATQPGNNDYSNGKAYFLQGAYANGPIYVNLAYWKEEAEGRVANDSMNALGVASRGAAGTDKRQIRLSGSYAFPFGLKVGLQLDRANQENSLTGVDTGTRTAWEIPVSYTFGPNTVLFSYTRARDLSTAAGSIADSGAKMFTLGYDYALSKRTNVGVFYSRLANDKNAAYQPFLAGTSATGSGLLAGETATQFAVGVKHTF